MANPAEHLEHVEHNAHASASGGFEKRVAMTVAIIAALLATVHSFENDAQAESLKFEIESGKEKTAAANIWAYYQAKNQRDNMFETMEELTSVVPSVDAAAKEKALARWKAKRDKYKTELAEHKKQAEDLEKKSNELHAKSEKEHHLANSSGRASLFLELGIVITSLAVLTRKPQFWYAGMGLAACGIGYGGIVIATHYLSH